MPPPLAPELANVLLGTSETVVYAAPTGFFGNLVLVDIFETSGADRTVWLFVGPEAEGKYRVRDHVAIANGRGEGRGVIYLAPGQSLRGRASAAAAVRVVVGGAEVPL